MRKWSELYEILQGIMGDSGRAYYQPPENLKLSYPCIVFERSNALIDYADNNPYQITKRYTITLMTKTADNDEFVDQLLNLPMCTYDRQFITEGIVHDVFSIYF